MIRIEPYNLLVVSSHSREKRFCLRKSFHSKRQFPLQVSWRITFLSMSSTMVGPFLSRKSNTVKRDDGEPFPVRIFHAHRLTATTGSIVTTKIGMSEYWKLVHLLLSNFWLSIRKFKPKLISYLGKGGQAKVFKAKFHGKDVAMKYIPLDSVKDGYDYRRSSYGCHEFWNQEKFTCKNIYLTTFQTYYYPY